MFQITYCIYLADLLQFSGLDTDMRIKLRKKMGEVSEKLTMMFRISGQWLMSCSLHECLNAICFIEFLSSVFQTILLKRNDLYCGMLDFFQCIWPKSIQNK